MEPGDRKVRIPRTSSRRTEQCWARLLCRVNGMNFTPMAFEGKLLRCGKVLLESELCPGPEYPRTPVLLEHAGIAEAGWGHRRSTQLYVLWRYERETGEWKELARAAGYGEDWACYLIPIAERALSEQWRLVKPKGDCSGAIAELTALLDRQLQDQAEERDRISLLNLLYNVVAHRLAESAEYGVCEPAIGSYNDRRGPKKERGGGEAFKTKDGEDDARTA